MEYKCVTLLIVCCLALAVFAQIDDGKSADSILLRKVRSPQRRGNVQIDYNQDRYGKRGSVQYNHNLHTSRDGRFKVDAYARGSRDFTHNRNDYGGGIQGSFRF